MSNGDLRQFLRDAEQLGFAFAGYTGSNHLRLYSADTGHRYVAAFTPSDWRSNRNAIAAMERLSGRKLPRQRSGKPRHHKQTQLNTALSQAEQRTSAQVAALVEEAGALRRQIDHLMAARPTRAAATEARQALTKYENLRSRLGRLHHVIPPIGGGMARN
jgi:hypothetical protein